MLRKNKRKKKGKGGGDAEGGYDTDCEHCGQGHPSNECPQGLGLCGYCYSPDHHASQCPELKPSGDFEDDGQCRYCDVYDCRGGRYCPNHPSNQDEDYGDPGGYDDEGGNAYKEQKGAWGGESQRHGRYDGGSKKGSTKGQALNMGRQNHNKKANGNKRR